MYERVSSFNNRVWSCGTRDFSMVFAGAYGARRRTRLAYARMCVVFARVGIVCAMCCVDVHTHAWLS
jgi:hypothetical protein